AYSLLLQYNQRELHKLRQKSADFDRNSVSRTYQFRENVVVMRMLFKMAGPFFTTMIPAFVFYVLYISLPKTEESEFVRMFSAAMFDWWIGIVCCLFGLLFPFSDVRFRRVAIRTPIFRSLQQSK
ncbi:hypothetical protein PENTCL1PPCAC_17203, partial [Pristionchus entomophagus]